MNSKENKISDNLGLVHTCAKRFLGKGIEYDDLFQAGCIGLIKAVNRFDESRNCKFSTYAVPVILGEIRQLFRSGGSVKIGRTLKELSIRAKRECEIFSSKFSRQPTIRELADILEVEDSQAALALNASLTPISLSKDDDETETDIRVDSYDESVVDRIALKQALGSLESRDRSIIVLRFFQDKTQKDTGDLLEMTQVQVSRREKKILQELRKELYK